MLINIKIFEISVVFFVYIIWFKIFQQMLTLNYILFASFDEYGTPVFDRNITQKLSQQ